MKARGLLILLVLSVCLSDLALADDPPITAVQLARPLSGGLSTHTNIENGVMTTTVLTGDPVMFRRTIAQTLNWSSDTTTDESNIYLEIGAVEQAQNGTKTCCKLSCDDGRNFHLDTNDGDCHAGSFGCQVCDYTCSSGWINCPAGTKLVPVVE
jgi:hypothetical protein